MNDDAISLKGKRVILYGTGSSACYFFDKYQNDCDLVAVTDGQIPGSQALQPFSSLGYLPLGQVQFSEYDFVVVASWAINDITPKLMEAGIAKDKICWFQHNKNRVVAGDHPDAFDAHPDIQEDKILYAFFDLNVARATFDILGFLCLAEHRRRELACQSVHVVVVNASNNPFNVAARGIMPASEHVWRKRQILAQSCGLLPRCSGTTFTSSRAEAQLLVEQAMAAYSQSTSSLFDAPAIFPDGYTVAQPVACWEFNELFAATEFENDISYLQAAPQAKVLATQFLDYQQKFLGQQQSLDQQRNKAPRKVVTITFRDSAIKPARNSNYTAWRLFIEQLDKNIYLPVLLPDTDNSWSSEFMALAQQTGAVMCSEAAFNVELRMAIYELSYLNLGVNNGPMHLCALSKHCRYLMYKQVTEDYAHTSTQSFIDRGFTIGGDFPAANRLQKLVWEDDNADVIIRTFNQLVLAIEQPQQNEAL